MSPIRSSSAVYIARPAGAAQQGVAAQAGADAEHAAVPLARHVAARQAQPHRRRVRRHRRQE